jgi:transcriptional regulator with XRE-family HTH domain
VRKKNIVGTRIKKARENAKPPITQKDLVARLQFHRVKIDQSAISKIESGERPVSDIEVKAIAKALKVSVAWLIEGDKAIQK